MTNPLATLMGGGKRVERIPGPPLPEIPSSVTEMALDTETTGTGYEDRPVGISWALPDGRRGYARWGHEMGGNNVDRAKAMEWVRREVDRPGRTVYFHNAPFDDRMLSYVNDHTPVFRHARLEDSNFMAALLNELEDSFSLDDLGEKYLGEKKKGERLYQWLADTFGGGATRKSQAENIWRAPGDLVEEYAEQDAVLTLKLAQFLRPKIQEENLGDVYTLETDLIPILLKMHLTGVRADVDKALRLRERLNERHQDQAEEFLDLVGREPIDGDPVDYGRKKHLVALWERFGIPYRLTEKGNPSITKDDLESMTHPVGMMVRRLRQLDHYRGTFIQSYILNNVGDGGWIHGEFHPLQQDFGYGTVSGRFSSGGALNLQNIPSRDEEWAPIIRGLFVPATPDHYWLKVDYSQIEYRFLAHYGRGQLVRAYNENPDVDFHELASEIVGIPRGDAKHINFGIVYGMGRAKMARQLGRSLDEAQEVLDEYHGRLPEVRRLYKKADRRANRRGYITTWGGRKRRFARSPNGYGHEYTYKALNALLQGSAADLIKKAMVELDKVLDWEATPMHLTVHDELDFSIPRGDTETPKMVKAVMEAFHLDVPVRADVEGGEDWGHVSEDYFKEAA